MALNEGAAAGVTDTARELNRVHEIHTHFLGCMGIGTEGDGHSGVPVQLQNVAAGIDFAAVLAQAGRVQLDGRPQTRGPLLQQLLDASILTREMPFGESVRSRHHVIPLLA